MKQKIMAIIAALITMMCFRYMLKASLLLIKMKVSSN